MRPECIRLKSAPIRSVKRDDERQPAQTGCVCVCGSGFDHQTAGEREGWETNASMKPEELEKSSKTTANITRNRVDLNTLYIPSLSFIASEPSEPENSSPSMIPQGSMYPNSIYFGLNVPV